MKSPRITPTEAAQIEHGIKGAAPRPAKCTHDDAAAIERRLRNIQDEVDAVCAKLWPSEISLLQRFMEVIFEGHRDPRSEAYRDGVHALLRCRLLATSLKKNPFEIGSAHADAWWAGVEEGKAVYRSYTQRDFPAGVLQ
jgi:hypothetical protein